MAPRRLTRLQVAVGVCLTAIFATVTSVTLLSDLRRGSRFRCRWVDRRVRILIGFGIDSGIEVVSGGALLLRLHHDLTDPGVNTLSGLRCKSSAGAS